MKKTSFEFNGDWEFELELGKFKIFNNSEYTRGNTKPGRGLFNIQIFDERNSNPDPEEYQINTINYLLDSDNQTKILGSLLKYSRDIIYPHYKTFMWESEYPDCYPDISKVEDLSKLYGINQIIVKTIGHENFAYYIFNCSSCLDYEHGITVTLFKDTVIDHGEDWDDKKVCEHKGIKYELYHEKAIKDYNQRELIITKPNPKYGKLKPWQKTQNDFYPFGLFHANKDQDLIEFIDSGKANKNVAPRLLEMSITNNRRNLTNYFLENSSHFLYPSFMAALKRKDYDLMDLILDKGFNVNERIAQSSPFYYTIGELTKQLDDLENRQEEIKLLKYLLKKGLDPYLEDKFKRNSYYRIERIDDKTKQDKILNILEDHGINIEKLNKKSKEKTEDRKIFFDMVKWLKQNKKK
jgi:hypothetical protein